MKATIQRLSSEYDFVGTSFYGNTILASRNALTKILGKPDHSCDDIDSKTQCEWDMELEMEDGSVAPITIYDWKEYRLYGATERIYWHIGGRHAYETEMAEKLLEDMLH